MTERISPTSDLGFKKSLGSPGNEDVLQGLVEDFFGFRPELADITITSPYSIKAYQELLRQADGTEKAAAKLRQTIQDVTADLKVAGFGAEIQIYRNTYFSKRSLYYAFDRFCANYNRQGEMARDADGSFLLYSSLKPVYALNILGYPHFPGDGEALRVFTLYDRKRDKAFEPEYITIAYFELTKESVETENQRHWRTYFRTGEAPEDAPGYIKKASRIIEKANLTQEERDVIDQLEKAEEIYKDTIHTAQIEGEKIGRVEGRVEGKIEERTAIARNLLGEGVPVEIVARATCLSREEIQRLIQ